MGVAQQSVESGNTLVLNGKLSETPIDVQHCSAFYEDDSGGTLSVSDILKKPFQPFAQWQAAQRQRQPKKPQWIRFSVQNGSSTDSVNGWLHIGRHGLIRLYTIDSLGHATLTDSAGSSIPANQLPSDGLHRMALSIVLRPQQQQTYLLNISSLRGQDLIYLTIYKPVAYRAFLNDFHQSLLPTFIFYVGLIACLLFMGVFAVAQFATNRDIIYVWYSLYVFMICLYFLRIWENVFMVDWWLPNHPLLRAALLPITNIVMTIFYLLFFSTLLELARYQPRLWQWYQYLLLALVGLLAFVLISYGVSDPTTVIQVYQGKIANVIVAFFLGSSIILACLALRSRHELQGYAFIGILLVVVGGAGTFLLNRIDVPYTKLLFQLPSLLFGASALLEVFCFSLALGRRTRLIEIEKNQIQEHYSQNLEAQLVIRTGEIEAKNQLLEQQRIQQREAEFDQRLADSEMTALRAQMNPHFIFNCLNSIKLYTLQNNTDKASDYLTKFARLIRLVLENSRAERVTLQNELEALQLYSDLEAMRFKHKLTISIRVDPDIDQQFVSIPPLLLQPYVENAIWHGLMHKPEGGTVSIDVSQPTDQYLHIEITDDGIGRARASTLKSKSAGKHKSFGMQVTADRIRMINQLYNTQTKAQILDLVAPNGEPLGTKVVLEIPV